MADKPHTDVSRFSQQHQHDKPTPSPPNPPLEGEGLSDATLPLKGGNSFGGGRCPSRITNHVPSPLARNQAEETDQSLLVVRHRPHDWVLILIRWALYAIIAQ